MISGILIHLWQSTLFAGGAWLLALVLRRNAARVRYRVLLIASLKFLIPFSLLVGLGSFVPSRVAPVPVAEAAKWIAVAEPLVALPAVAQPVMIEPTSDNADYFAVALFVLWACGFAAIALYWIERWKRAHKMCGSATLLRTCGSVPVMSVPGITEPGVFGIFRQVLILPDGIEEQLDHAQMEAVLAHELCHVRRRDNLTASLHMVVQAIFWFHPLVWWLGTRLMEERELACDEEVLRLGGQPQVYAAAILSVCKLYVETPLACVAGIVGSDASRHRGMNLRKRIEAIVAKRTAFRLNFARKALLACAAIVVVGGPVAVGVLHLPTVQAQTAQKFEAASIRLSKDWCGGTQPYSAAKEASPQTRGRGSLTSAGRLNECHSLADFIHMAYVMYADGQFHFTWGPQFESGPPIEGGPAWVRSDSYQITAKAERAESREVMSGPMLQTLLENRFHLKLHRQTRDVPVFNLTVAKEGAKLTPSRSDCVQTTPRQPGDPPTQMLGPNQKFCMTIIGRPPGLKPGIHAESIPLDRLCLMLSRIMGRPVINKTGIEGRFDMTLEFVADQATPGFPAPLPLPGAPPEPPEDPAGASIFTAVQQLGLRLESAKGPGEFLVIDHVERPSEN
jgi:uncharacterized protein (TIGR03435 family)